jgi:hypothetical protein
MAIGGRSLGAAWSVGLLCLFLVAGTVWLAWPSLPAVGDWLVSAVDFFFDWLREITPPRA